MVETMIEEGAGGVQEPTSRYRWEDREAIGAEILGRLERAGSGVRKAGKVYRVQKDGKWTPAPGVTTINGNLDKSRPLLIWATRLQVAADEEVAWRLAKEGLPPGLSRETFHQMFVDASDKQQAHQKALEEAGNLGTAVHAQIEHAVSVMLGRPIPEPTVSDEAMWVFAGWEAWAKENEFLPIVQEFPVWSSTYHYAGSPDVLAWVRRRLRLVDWKTSNGVYGEHWLQNAAYRQALVEMGVLDEVLPGLLVRLPKDVADANDGLETHDVPVEDQEELFGVFKALRTIYPWKKKEDENGLIRWRAKKAKEASRAA